MPLNHKVAVIGTSIVTPLNDESRSLEENLYDIVQSALKDAGLKIHDIDGIVVAGNDQFDGRAISVMMASGSVGGVDRDILSTPSSAEHAFVMGALRVASGQYRTQLVVAWGPTAAEPLSEAERLGADPYFHRTLPLDERASFALQASAIASRHPGAQALAERMAANNAKDGAMAEWPLSPGMIAPPIGGAVALVLASEAVVKEKPRASHAWVLGMGWATEAGFLGDRDLTQADALDAAVKQAFGDAGLTGLADVDVIELTAPTPYQELLVCERMGIAGPNEWAQHASDRNRRWRINPSGGVAAANPVYCGGLIRVAEAANQVRGTAGGHQVKGCKRALAHAASGFAMMYQSVVIFGNPN